LLTIAGAQSNFPADVAVYRPRPPMIAASS
jgi:hypothetical protein